MKLKTFLKALIVLLIGTLIGSSLAEIAIAGHIGLAISIIMILLAITVIILVCVKFEEIIKTLDNNSDTPEWNDEQ